MASALERLSNELSGIGFRIAKANAEKVDVERVMDELRLEPIRGAPTSSIKCMRYFLLSTSHGGLSSRTGLEHFYLFSFK